MNPAIAVGLALFSAMSSVISGMTLYIVADLKGDIRELRTAVKELSK